MLYCSFTKQEISFMKQSVISDLTVTTGTFKNRLKSALYGRAFLQ